MAGFGLICHWGISDGEMQTLVASSFKKGHFARTPEISSTKNTLAIPDISWVKSKKPTKTPFPSVNTGMHSGFDYLWQNEKPTPKGKQEKQRL